MTTESTPTMVVHGAIVGAVLYMVMRYLLKQPNTVAVDRSTVVGLLVATYMIVFGHTFPPRLTPSFQRRR